MEHCKLKPAPSGHAEIGKTSQGLFARIAKQAEHDEQVVDSYDAVIVHIGGAAFFEAPKDAERIQQVTYISDAVVVDISKAESAWSDTTRGAGGYVVPVLIGDFGGIQQTDVSRRV
jgi:hypothetical protein